MLGLPVLWLALHGTLRQVWASVIGVGIVLAVPILVAAPRTIPRPTGDVRS